MRTPIHSFRSDFSTQPVIAELQHDDLPDLVQQCNTELPTVVEDLLSFYDEIGRSTVRTRYMDNLRFEKRLIQSKLRSKEESSRPQRESMASATPLSIHTTQDESAASSSLEDHFQVVSVDDADEITRSSAEANMSPVDADIERGASHELMSQNGPSMEIVEEVPPERPLKLVDGAASLVSSYKMLSNEVLSSLVLLRTISEQEWIEFDHPESEELDDSMEGEPDSAVDDGITVDESDQLKEDFERGQRLSTISEAIRENRITLDVDDYNAMLARLALSPELSPDEIILRLMGVCDQMKKQCLLDSTTYEIILLAFGRRFAASPAAAKFVLGVTSNVEWSPKMMEAAAAICEHHNNHTLADKLLKVMRSTPVLVPKRAYRSLLNYAQIDDNRDYALHVIEHAIDVSSMQHAPYTHGLVSHHLS